jgi:hypothetical protein
MVGLYTPLLIMQAICLYHAYRNNAEQRWYWFIIFFPGVGCAIYLAHNFYNRNNIQTLKQGLNEVVNSNYRIEQLEKQLKFVDNVANKLSLADAYAANGRHPEAIALYRSCQGDAFMADDPALQMKLLQSLFLNKEYTEAIALGQRLTPEKSFKNAEARIAYAWSLYHTGQPDAAVAIFEDLNKSFTNYKHRLAYAHFLLDTQKTEALHALLQELLDEFEHMKPQERKYHSQVMREVRNLTRSLSQKAH